MQPTPVLSIDSLVKWRSMVGVIRWSLQVRAKVRGKQENPREWATKQRPKPCIQRCKRRLKPRESQIPTQLQSKRRSHARYPCLPVRSGPCWSRKAFSSSVLLVHAVVAVVTSLMGMESALAKRFLKKIICTFFRE
jgi:hypothetical protein